MKVGQVSCCVHSDPLYHNVMMQHYCMQSFLCTDWSLLFLAFRPSHKEVMALKEPRPSGHSPNDGSSLLDLILHFCQSLSRSPNLFALCLQHGQALRARLFYFSQQAQRFLYGRRRLFQLFRISSHLSSVLLWFVVHSSYLLALISTNRGCLCLCCFVGLDFWGVSVVLVFVGEFMFPVFCSEEISLEEIGVGGKSGVYSCRF